MKNVPSISVIVPTFDRARMLQSCVDSLIAQTLPPHQIIVVDDGSRDETQHVISSYGSAVSSVRTENAGKSAAVNRGLQEVDGEFVWVLDDDDVAEPDALERLVEPLARDEVMGFSYGTKYFCECDANGTITGISGRSRVPERYDRRFVVDLLKSCFLGGASTLVRRSVYEAVGGYDVSLVRSQDYEMALRIALRFPGARAAGGPTYCHRLHGGMRGSLSDRFSSTRRMQKWEEYNRLFIRRLCEELPLETFSPVEDEAERRDRGDVLPALHRAAVRAAHGLADDVSRDLLSIAAGDFEGAIGREELEAAAELGRRLGSSRSAPQGLTRFLRDPEPRMAAVASSIERYYRLSSAWHALPRPVRKVLRFARTAVVSDAREDDSR